MAFYANIVALDSGRELCLFKLFPVTLTLAGIAGFILSIGIAVDSNVLIFERMKEEIKKKIIALNNIHKNVLPISIHDWDSLEKVKKILNKFDSRI